MTIAETKQEAAKIKVLVNMLQVALVEPEEILNPEELVQVRELFEKIVRVINPR